MSKLHPKKRYVYMRHGDHIKLCDETTDVNEFVRTPSSASPSAAPTPDNIQCERITELNNDIMMPGWTKKVFNGKTPVEYTNMPAPNFNFMRKKQLFCSIQDINATMKDILENRDHLECFFKYYLSFQDMLFFKYYLNKNSFSKEIWEVKKRCLPTGKTWRRIKKEPTGSRIFNTDVYDKVRDAFKRDEGDVIHLDESPSQFSAKWDDYVTLDNSSWAIPHISDDDAHVKAAGDVAKCIDKASADYDAFFVSSIPQIVTELFYTHGAGSNTSNRLEKLLIDIVNEGSEEDEYEIKQEVNPIEILQMSYDKVGEMIVDYLPYFVQKEDEAMKIVRSNCSAQVTETAYKDRNAPKTPSLLNLGYANLCPPHHKLEEDTYVELSKIWGGQGFRVEKGCCVFDADKFENKTMKRFRNTVELFAKDAWDTDKASRFLDNFGSKVTMTIAQLDEEIVKLKASDVQNSKVRMDVDRLEKYRENMVQYSAITHQIDEWESAEARLKAFQISLLKENSNLGLVERMRRELILRVEYSIKRHLSTGKVTKFKLKGLNVDGSETGENGLFLKMKQFGYALKDMMINGFIYIINHPLFAIWVNDVLSNLKKQWCERVMTIEQRPPQEKVSASERLVQMNTLTKKVVDAIVNVKDCDIFSQRIASGLQAIVQLFGVQADGFLDMLSQIMSSSMHKMLQNSVYGEIFRNGLGELHKVLNMLECSNDSFMGLPATIDLTSCKSVERARRIVSGLRSMGRLPEVIVQQKPLPFDMAQQYTVAGIALHLMQISESKDKSDERKSKDKSDQKKECQIPSSIQYIIDRIIKSLKSNAGTEQLFKNAEEQFSLDEEKKKIKASGQMWKKLSDNETVDNKKELHNEALKQSLNYIVEDRVKLTPAQLKQSGVLDQVEVLTTSYFVRNEQNVSLRPISDVELKKEHEDNRIIISWGNS